MFPYIKIWHPMKVLDKILNKIPRKQILLLVTDERWHNVIRSAKGISSAAERSRVTFLVFIRVITKHGDDRSGERC